MIKFILYPRKGDFEGQKVIGNILLNIAGIVRSLIEWVLIVGGLGVAYLKTGSPYVLYLMLLAYAGLGIYLMGLFSFYLRMSIFNNPDKWWKLLLEGALYFIVSVGFFILILIFLSAAIDSIVDSGVL